MQNIQIKVSTQATSDEVATILDGLTKASSSVSPRNEQSISIIVRDENEKMIGGLTGSTYWDHLDIKLLWVDEAARGTGLGQQLVKQAEDEALKRGCNGAIVDTYDFQALGFYQKLGYTVFGVKEEFPKGHQRYFLNKKLS